jgi:hypothetical protein
LPVKVAGKIEEVYFDAQGRMRILECWAIADVEHGAVELSVEGGVYGIHTVGRKSQPGGVNIGGGKAQGVAEPISRRDNARDGIGAAQHLTGEIELAFSDAAANASATDGLAVQCEGSDTVHGELEVETESPEHLHIAATIVAENKIRPYADTLDPLEISCEVANEQVSRLPTQGLVEVQQQEVFHPQSADGADLL